MELCDIEFTSALTMYDALSSHMRTVNVTLSVPSNRIYFHRSPTCMIAAALCSVTNSLPTSNPGLNAHNTVPIGISDMLFGHKRHRRTYLFRYPLSLSTVLIPFAPVENGNHKHLVWRGGQFLLPTTTTNHSMLICLTDIKRRSISNRKRMMGLERTKDPIGLDERC